MQIDGEGVENMFINMMLQKKLQKYTYEKTPFHDTLFGNGLNKFQAIIWYDEILWDFIVILPKLILTNHCH
jgi:hypothetical protein